MDDILMLALRDGYFACQNAKGAQNLEKEISMLCDKDVLSKPHTTAHTPQCSLFFFVTKCSL